MINYGDSGSEVICKEDRKARYRAGSGSLGRLGERVRCPELLLSRGKRLRPGVSKGQMG